jgi:predicted DNA-binding transcriptional regulator AlpA
MDEQHAATVFLTADNLCQLLSVSRRTLRYWASKGLLPAPLRLGPSGRTLRWHIEEVLAFLRQSHLQSHADGEMATDGMERQNLNIGTNSTQQPTAMVGNDGQDPTPNGLFLGPGSGKARQRTAMMGKIRHQTDFFGTGQRQRPATNGNDGQDPTPNGLFLGPGSGNARQRTATRLKQSCTNR